MFKTINNYKNLFVADFSKTDEKIIKIIFSKYPNFSVDGQIIYPFAKDVETESNILVSNTNNIKKLSYYVNCFGFPKRNIYKIEKPKQKLVIEKVKTLKKQKKI